MLLTAAKPSPAGAFARSQDGLRVERRGRSTPSRALMPSRMAVKPCGVRYFSPLRAARRLGDDGDAFELGHGRHCTGWAARPRSQAPA